MAWVIMAPSEDMRVASHGGTRPPWSGKSALPVRLAIRSLQLLRRRLIYQTLNHHALALSIGHGPERDRITRRLDGGNAVFPYLPRFAGHHVKRGRLGIERVAPPLFAKFPSEPEFARRAERKAENPVEMRLVAVPADPHADVVFGTKNLRDVCRRSAERFDHYDERTKPVRYWLGVLQPSQRIIVTEPERGHAALAFIGAKLERF